MFEYVNISETFFWFSFLLFYNFMKWVRWTSSDQIIHHVHLNLFSNKEIKLNSQEAEVVLLAPLCQTLCAENDPDSSVQFCSSVSLRDERLWPWNISEIKVSDWKTETEKILHFKAVLSLFFLEKHK